MFRKILIIALLTLPVAGICKQRSRKKPDQKPAAQKITDNTDYKAMGAPMPAIRAITYDNKEIVNSDLKGEGNVLLMLFNPTCEHCVDMTLLMEKNIFLFKKTKTLLMASANMTPYLTYFQNNTKTLEYPSIKVGIDSAKAIDVLYNYVTLPQINIYNNEHKLIKTFNGDTPLDSLKMYID